MRRRKLRRSVPQRVVALHWLRRRRRRTVFRAAELDYARPHQNVIATALLLVLALCLQCSAMVCLPSLTTKSQDLKHTSTSTISQAADLLAIETAPYATNVTTHNVGAKSHVASALPTFILHPRANTTYWRARAPTFFHNNASSTTTAPPSPIVDAFFGNYTTTTTTGGNTWSAYASFVNQTSGVKTANETAKTSAKQTSDTMQQQVATEQSRVEMRLAPSVRRGQQPARAELERDESEFPRVPAGDDLAPAAGRGALSVGHYQRVGAHEPNTSWAQLARQAAESNVMESLMVTGRSVASLLCEPEYMLVRLSFREPFRGLVATNSDGRRACRVVGTGARIYELRVSLHDCGTRQELPRLFVNNILVQYEPAQHPSSIAALISAAQQRDNSSRLNEILQHQHAQQQQQQQSEDAELKTIICSYPIRPRAQPPPERIIETGTRPRGAPPAQIQQQQQQPGEGARLVFYEPLVLVGSLLMLSLSLLGLTMGAYAFVTRIGTRRDNFSLQNATALVTKKRPPRSPQDGASYRAASVARLGAPVHAQLSPSASSSSSSSPSRHRIVSPPLIGLPAHANRVRLYAHAETAKARQQQTRAPQIQSSGVVDMISTNPTGRQANADSGADSLSATETRTGVNGALNDSSSVTTIEIPYTRPAATTSGPMDSARTSSSALAARIDATPSSKRRNQPLISAQTRAAAAAAATRRPHSRSRSFSHLAAKAVAQAAGGRSRNAHRRANSTSSAAAAAAADARKVVGIRGGRIARRLSGGGGGGNSKQVQAGGVTPPFGSLRARLTSWREFRRLENIASLFDEIIVENQATAAPIADLSSSAYSVRLKPSKYRSRIMHELDERQRKLVHDALHNDELFRSLVVDATDCETFRRKLRDNSVYAQKFTPNTWRLLEDIMLDSELGASANATAAAASSNYDQDGRHVDAANAHANELQRVANDDDDKLRAPQIGATFERSMTREIREQVQRRTLVERRRRPTPQPQPPAPESVLAARDARSHAQQHPTVSAPEADERRDSLEREMPHTPLHTSPQPMRRERQSRSKQTEQQQQQQQANVAAPANSLKSQVRVSQFNSTQLDGGALTGTLINIDSVTNFTSSRAFSTYTRSSIEHTTFDNDDDGGDEKPLGEAGNGEAPNVDTSSSLASSLAFVDERVVRSLAPQTMTTTTTSPPTTSSPTQLERTSAHRATYNKLARTEAPSRAVNPYN